MESNAWKTYGERISNTILEAIPGGSIIVNRRGLISSANSKIEKFLGLKKSSIIGCNLRDLPVEITVAISNKPYKERSLLSLVVKGNAVQSTGCLLKQRDGMDITVCASIHPLVSSSGEPNHLIVTFFDPTKCDLSRFHIKQKQTWLDLRLQAQNQAKKDLRENEKMLRIVSNRSKDGVIIEAADGKTVFCNQQMKVISGYSIEEIKRSGWFNLVFPDQIQRREIINLVKQAFLSDDIHIETPIKSKDSKNVWVSLSVIPLAIFGNRLRLVIIEDTTNRKNAEEELSKAKGFSDALNNINMTINSTLEFDEVMRMVIVDATKAIGAETSAIFLRDGETWIAKYTYGLPKELNNLRFSIKNIPFAAVASKSKKTIIINDAYHDGRVNSKMVKAYQIRSMLVVPLIVRGESTGVLVFNYHSTQLDFSEHQIDFANKLSAAISLALENVSRYATERNIADTLQEALLTIPEHITNIDFGHLYRSSTEATRVGGDFYDLFELEHGRIGILIGDVAGKGLEAAAFTSVVKNTVKAYAHENYSPASIIAKTNELINKLMPESMFVTLFFGLLDTTIGRLSYCSAGHPPAIIKRLNSGIQFLTTSSPVIGAFKNITFHDEEIMLNKGDIFIGYTDGVIEARYDSQFFGEERLVNFIRGLNKINVAKLPLLIFGEIMGCTGGVLSDDVAILCLSLKVSK